MSYAVKAENITKSYCIRHQARQAASLREAFEQSLRRTLAWLGFHGQHTDAPEAQARTENYLALRDVFFEIAHGQNLAIIGQNGAGKSTLLKILSRITEPDSGRITIRGRVSSLLEVGTGFHPELTGRENIFLNGTILGMPRVEIKKKFDEIVAFSEIEQFIDTPVKYYSSGMYVRLAFAVAANLEPEILILDEVLAVGDLRFQKKCLEKMQYVSCEGRTIIFVSHNMQSVAQICPTTMFLEKGSMRSFGPTADAIKDYMGVAAPEASDTLSDSTALFRPESYIGDDKVQLVETCIKDAAGCIRALHRIHEPVYLEIRYRVFDPVEKYFVPNFHIYNMENILVFLAVPKNEIVSQYEPGLYQASCELPPHLLNEGVFRIMPAISSFGGITIVHCSVPYAMTFTIKDDLTDISYRNGYLQSIPGLVRPRFTWTVGKIA